MKGKDLNNNAYKRMVDVTDEGDNSIYVAPETPSIKGQFLLSDKAVLKRLSKGKMIRLYLQMEPVNDKSKMPSRKLFIGNLTAK